MLLRSLFIVVIGLGIVGTVFAQGDGNDACLSLVESALQRVGSACVLVGQEEACYGNSRVVASFQPGVGGVFNSSGDMVAVADLQALFTEPADPATGVWGVAIMTLQVQGDQPLKLVLFGDTQVSDITIPETNAATCTITNATTNNINIRSGPGTDRGIVGAVSAGEALTATGRNAASDWYFIDRNGVTGWVFASLFTGACDQLPVLNETEVASVVPARAIAVQTGTSSACSEAPNILMLHSPDGQRSRIVVNGVQLELASTGYITARPDDQMVIHGLEGEITVGEGDEAVTLLPGYWTVVDLDGLDAITPPAPAQLIPSEGVVPTLIEVVIYGEDFAEAIADDLAPIVEHVVDEFECEVGESLQFDLPLGFEPDVDTTIGISYGATEGLAATMTGLESLRVTCLQPGTHTLFVSIQYSADLSETLSYTFVTSANLDNSLPDDIELDDDDS